MDSRKILEVIALTNKKFPHLTLSQLIATILRKKNNLNQDFYFWTDEQLYNAVLNTLEELKSDPEYYTENKSL